MKTLEKLRDKPPTSSDDSRISEAPTVFDTLPRLIMLNMLIEDDQVMCLCLKQQQSCPLERATTYNSGVMENLHFLLGKNLSGCAEQSEAATLFPGEFE